MRHLLTQPGAALASVRLARVTAHIASLKWTRPQYSEQLARTFGREVDYAKTDVYKRQSLILEAIASARRGSQGASIALHCTPSARISARSGIPRRVPDRAAASAVVN